MIGLSRARRGIHPSESPRAATVHFDTIVSAVANAIGSEVDASLATSTVAVGVERRRIARKLHDRLGRREIGLAQRHLGLYRVFRYIDLTEADTRLALPSRGCGRRSRSCAASRRASAASCGSGAWRSRSWTFSKRPDRVSRGLSTSTIASVFGKLAPLIFGERSNRPS